MKYFIEKFARNGKSVVGVGVICQNLHRGFEKFGKKIIKMSLSEILTSDMLVTKQEWETSSRKILLGVPQITKRSL